MLNFYNVSLTMWLFPQPTEVTFKTSRSKTEVIESLGQMASFKGDRFKFPVRIFGNKLFVERKVVIGKGVVKETEEQTHVHVRLQASDQIEIGFVITAILSLMTFLIALGVTLSGNLHIIMGIGLMFISPFWLIPPRITYLSALEIRKSSIENLVLYGD